MAKELSMFTAQAESSMVLEIKIHHLQPHSTGNLSLPPGHGRASTCRDGVSG